MKYLFIIPCALKTFQIWIVWRIEFHPFKDFTLWNRDLLPLTLTQPRQQQQHSNKVTNGGSCLFSRHTAINCKGSFCWNCSVNGDGATQGLSSNWFGGGRGLCWPITFPPSSLDAMLPLSTTTLCMPCRRLIGS